MTDCHAKQARVMELTEQLPLNCLVVTLRKCRLPRRPLWHVFCN